MRMLAYLLSAALLAGLAACDMTYQQSAQERVARAEQGRGDVVIGVVWEQQGYPRHFVEGAQLAVDEINVAGGILGGRKIRLHVAQQEKNAPKQIAANLDLVAVVGHANSDSAIAGAVTYAYHNILFLAPHATNIKLTQHGFENVFRTTPNNAVLAQALAEFCHAVAEYKKIVILHSRDSHSEELGAMFYEAATRQKIQIVQFSSYFSQTRDLRRLIARFKNKSFDAIFIADGYQSGGQLMRQIREMGITAPFIGSDQMDSFGLWQSAKEAAEGTVVPSVFDPRGELARQFIEKFTFAYPELEVDSAAAQGYDAIKLLAYVMHESSATIPIVVGNTLRYMPRWLGVTGEHLFDENGEIISKAVVFKALRNGRFEYLAAKPR